MEFLGGFSWHFPALMAGIYGYGAPLWVALPGFALVAISQSFIKTGLRSKSGSLRTGVVLHASHNMFAMGSFYTLTVHEGYANYLVSETGIFLRIVYIIISWIVVGSLLKKGSTGRVLSGGEVKSEVAPIVNLADRQK